MSKQSAPRLRVRAKLLKSRRIAVWPSRLARHLRFGDWTLPNSAGPGLLLVLLGCGEGKEMPATTRSIDTQAAAYRVYQSAICHRCHGLKLEGGPKAPGLLQLARYYDVAQLERYLVAPDSLQAVDPRLKALDEQYTTFEMPSYAMLDSTVRRSLVAFLLSPWTTP